MRGHDGVPLASLWVRRALLLLVAGSPGKLRKPHLRFRKVAEYLFVSLVNANAKFQSQASSNAPQPQARAGIGPENHPKRSALRVPGRGVADTQERFFVVFARHSAADKNIAQNRRETFTIGRIGFLRLCFHGKRRVCGLSFCLPGRRLGAQLCPKSPSLSAPSPSRRNRKAGCRIGKDEQWRGVTVVPPCVAGRQLYFYFYFYRYRFLRAPFFRRSRSRRQVPSRLPHPKRASLSETPAP